MIEDLKPYPEYKDSGLPWLGEVPAHWGIRRNGGLFQQRNDSGNNELPILEVSLRTGVRVRDFATSKRKQVMTDHSKYKRAGQGDLVYNMMRMWQGAAGIAPVSGLVSPAYVVCRALPGIDPDYFSRLFKTDDYLAEIDAASRGIVKDRNRLYWDQFKQICSPLPPASEQAAIARFLAWATNRLDRAIRAKRRIIALLQEQKQAIIHRAVTRGLDPFVPLKDSGIPWLGEIPEHWEVRQVRRVANFVTSGSRGWADYYSDSGLVFIQSGNLGRDMALKFHYIQHVQPPSGAEGERTLVQTDDLLICITGALTGNVVHVDVDLPGPSFVNQHVALVRVSRQLVKPRFLAFTLRSGIGQSQLKTSEYGGTKQGLGLGDVKDVCFPLPPHDEQQKIIIHLDARLAVFSTAISRLESEITLLREYRTRLIADVVTGKLDVRKVAKGLPEEEPLFGQLQDDTGADIEPDAEDEAREEIA
jgi:type I restriction enzyme S subunit